MRTREVKIVTKKIRKKQEHPPGQFRSEHAPVLDGGMHIAHIVTHKCTRGFGCCIEGRVVERCTNEDILDSMTPHRGACDAEVGDMRRRTMVIGRRRHYGGSTYQRVIS